MKEYNIPTMEISEFAREEVRTGDLSSIAYYDSVAENANKTATIAFEDIEFQF